MRQVIFMLVLSAGLLAVACGGEATDPTATAAVTSSPTATSTPSVAREWNLEDIRVDGTTVTVSLHVFAGIDVKATLDGGDPDQVNAPIPILEFIFLNVAPGQHTV